MDNQSETKVDAPHAGQVIADRLRELGKSQAWLKDQLGVSHTAVSLWIRSGMISYKHAKKVAEVLKIPASVMLGLASEEEAQREDSQQAIGSHVILAYITLDEEGILRAWRETDEAGRGILSAVAKQVPRRKVEQAS